MEVQSSAHVELESRLDSSWYIFTLANEVLWLMAHLSDYATVATLSHHAYRMADHTGTIGILCIENMGSCQCKQFPWFKEPIKAKLQPATWQLS